MISHPHDGIATEFQAGSQPACCPAVVPDRQIVLPAALPACLGVRLALLALASLLCSEPLLDEAQQLVGGDLWEVGDRPKLLRMATSVVLRMSKTQRPDARQHALPTHRADRMSRAPAIASHGVVSTAPGTMIHMDLLLAAGPRPCSARYRICPAS
jgi:hypothetical protein